MDGMSSIHANHRPTGLTDCNVTWTTPSADSAGSMPLGNGDIGLNAWVEPNGDLVFYISKTDAWSEIARLLKIGRVRVRLSPARAEPFEQTLDLERGEMRVRLGDLELAVWVDAHHPVVHVEARGPRPFEVEARAEIWRAAPREIAGDELFSAYGMLDAPHPVVESGDALVTPAELSNAVALRGAVVWHHRNPSSIWGESMALQGLDGLLPASADPLIDRTFGAALAGEGLQRVPDQPAALRSALPASRHLLSIHVLTAQTASAGAWLEQLDRQAARANAADFSARRAAHAQWWRDFWQRSWIYAAGPGADVVTRGYALQRYINACAGRGAYPIKFNGSLFTVDADEARGNGQPIRFDADYRSWGGPYWFQNTRLAYWPMLAAGDYDLMAPLFQMVLDALPLLKARTRRYFGHAGAFFPETMDFWGTYANTNYGWDRAGKPAHLPDNRYIGRYYSCGLELLALMLDYAAHTQDAGFTQRALLPWAQEILAFYDQHYPRDARGRLLMKPAQALETWQDAQNPAPDIAGLRHVLDRLANDPQSAAGDWARLRRELPGLPVGEEGGQAVLLPAEAVFEEARNVENAELYSIFPFRLHGVNRPGLDLARATFDARRFRHNIGWCQDSIQAACLGLAAQARDMLVERFSKKHARSRFPAFWGPNFDWIPDQDHGAAGMITLQAMLMQPGERGEILLLPAWPEDWDVSFRLNAPMNTVVEGVYARGRLQELKVTPESRRAAVNVSSLSSLSSS
jgi:hypothetical protein